MIRSFFTTHPIMKAISLGLASVLWFFVHGEQSDERKFKVEVQVVNPPKDLVMTDHFDSDVSVTIIGPRTRLSSLGDLKPHVIDLSDAVRGINTFWITEDHFRIPRGTQITRISPQRIRVTLERAEERLIRVEPRFIGELDLGFEVEKYEVTPPYLKVRGSRREIAALGSLRTEPINLSGRISTFEGTFDVYGLDPYWEADRKEVEVRVTVNEKEVSRIMEDIPVRVAGVEGKVIVRPETVTLMVKGPFRQVASLVSERPAIEIDGRTLDMARLKRKTVRVRPVPPKRPGLEVKMIPENVQVTLGD